MGVRKTNGEIERMKEEIRELLFEKGFRGMDWYEVVWGVLIRQVKKNMEIELSRRLGV